LWPTFEPFFGPAAILFLFFFFFFRQSAKEMGTQAASVSLNMLTPPDPQQNKVLRNNTESSTKKFVAQYKIEAVILGNNTDRLWAAEE
jgi:hypothetical protein